MAPVAALRRTRGVRQHILKPARLSMTYNVMTPTGGRPHAAPAVGRLTLAVRQKSGDHPEARAAWAR